MTKTPWWDTPTYPHYHDAEEDIQYETESKEKETQETTPEK